MKIDFFSVKNEQSLVELKAWLKKKWYNSWPVYQKDRNGDPIASLRYDSKPNSDWGKVGPVQGIVVVKNHALEKQTFKIIEEQSS